MIGLFCFALAVLASPFRSKLQLEAENAVLRHQHVAGYSIFNDGSVRDFQLRTPQWTIGKNFDGTGAFGPDFVTADELPPGCEGLRIRGRFNGEVVQDAPIADLIFDVRKLVALISATMTLEAGDIIVTGTPSGIGLSFKLRFEVASINPRIYATMDAGVRLLGAMIAILPHPSRPSISVPKAFALGSQGFPASRSWTSIPSRSCFPVDYLVNYS